MAVSQVILQSQLLDTDYIQDFHLPSIPLIKSKSSIDSEVIMPFSIIVRKSHPHAFVSPPQKSLTKGQWLISCGLIQTQKRRISQYLLGESHWICPSPPPLVLRRVLVTFSEGLATRSGQAWFTNSYNRIRCPISYVRINSVWRVTPPCSTSIYLLFGPRLITAIVVGIRQAYWKLGQEGPCTSMYLTRPLKTRRTVRLNRRNKVLLDGCVFLLLRNSASTHNAVFLATGILPLVSSNLCVPLCANEYTHALLHDKLMLHQ